MRERVTVLKFGGSVLRSEEDLASGVHEVYRWLRRGHRVVAVVSAFEGTTDALLDRARGFVGEPPADAHALLLSTGESTTAALLALALARAGTPARVLGPHALGLRTRGEGSDADPASVSVDALLGALRAAPVVVVPGFIGAGGDGNVTLLGRGGSDLTALFIAAELGNTHCRLIKDVDGLYDRDPARAGPAARRYRTLSWGDALALDGGIVQHKAVRLAQARGLSFEVGSFQREDCSTVGALPVAWHGAATSVATQPAPVRVAVLGCGTVGTGVVRHLARLRDHFAVAGVLVRDGGRARPLPEGVRATTDPVAALRSADVVVEAIGGTGPARTLVADALERGLHVVTANKALLAAHGEELAGIARAHGVTLGTSACVGGGVPMLEAVRRAAESGGVRAVEGVVNGTTNFVLERVARGDPLDAAVRDAQHLGYAEADPTRDLDGTDSLEKLALLARAAFGEGADLSRLTRAGLLGREFPELIARLDGSHAIRLVAWAGRDPDEPMRIIGGVAPTLVPEGHALHALPGAANRLTVWDVHGAQFTCSGAGAGGWPTAESVLADLWDVWRGLRAASQQPRGVHHAA